MNELQQEEFNLKIRKMLKEFGVKAHKLVLERFETADERRRIPPPGALP